MDASVQPKSQEATFRRQCEYWIVAYLLVDLRMKIYFRMETTTRTWIKWKTKSTQTVKAGHGWIWIWIWIWIDMVCTDGYMGKQPEYQREKGKMVQFRVGIPFISSFL